MVYLIVVIGALFLGACAASEYAFFGGSPVLFVGVLFFFQGLLHTGAVRFGHLDFDPGRFADFIFFSGPGGFAALILNIMGPGWADNGAMFIKFRGESIFGKVEFRFCSKSMFFAHILILSLKVF